ncbi:murein DD-endopeptidase MepM/ murein hydrolase activator NlpD [Orenia metallireducens]|uniref:Murein DD-endopeptidase MepM and murein hydrolase activator NlpD, contain LysM domain n=2 Tax=Orenia metallireducens TaxID=1413210 RepID=A0A285IAD8_9FIRM|nr:M23 family metallopeptidase [Orenia metallireducens]PRX22387.1 murein DD-endopeptidase MepM/ murein hydrolase activator NlpD [Orenia metallireducens]SNY44036.1 Murein DD-endopeptidase MepM and murein hydrolase activator NlpD, contain LysM domain [Orenia metallireducens]
MLTKKSFYILISNLIIMIVLTSIGVVSAKPFVTNQAGIKRVQYNLLILGYGIALTGEVDSQTYKSLVDFQQRNKLRASGEIDIDTFFKLEDFAGYMSHKVVVGDTLESIARGYDVSVDMIKRLNKLTSWELKVGEELIIPQNGLEELAEYNLNKVITYILKPEDSLAEIARKFNTTVEVLQRVNNIEDIRGIEALRIPISIVKSQYKSKNLTRDEILNNLIAPTVIRVSSKFGYREHPIKKKRILHKGVDLAVVTGTKVKAIYKGTVLYSGWIRGYGKTVTIDHGNGIVSLYAHNSKLLVSKGEKVKAGEIITLSGNTGRSTGPHLHLGLYINNEAVDPLRYIK